MPQREEIAYQILRTLRRILRRISQHSREIARESGLSIPQMLCMKAIDGLRSEAEITVAMIASAVQLTPATVSRILDRLEQRGFVVRERRSQDRRRVCVTLSDAGKAQLDDLPQPLNEAFLQRIQRLETGERMTLLASLTRIVELLDAEGLDASPVLTTQVDVGTDTPLVDHPGSG